MTFETSRWNSMDQAIVAAIDEIVKDDAEGVVSVHRYECLDSGPCICGEDIRFLVVPPAYVGEWGWFMSHLDDSIRHPHEEPFT